MSAAATARERRPRHRRGGEGVSKDPIEAARLYRAAAEHGNDTAQYLLAAAYEDGIGVSADLSEAARYYTMAAEKGHGGAQHCLALLYWKGRGVKRDRRAAMRWALTAVRNPVVARYTTRWMARDAAWACAILALAWLLLRSGVFRSR